MAIQKQVAESINKVNLPKDVEDQINFYKKYFGSVNIAPYVFKDEFTKARQNLKMIQEYADINERYRAIIFVVHMNLVERLDRFRFENKIPTWIMKNLATLARKYGFEFVDVYSEFEDLTDQFSREALSTKSCSKDHVLRKYSRNTEAQIKDESRARTYFALE